MKFLLMCIPLSLGCRSDTKAFFEPPSEGEVTTDVDGDGFLNDEDCDDEASMINPSAIEVCDGIDNNCDGAIDEGVGTTFYLDQDDDGFGDDATIVEACDPPEGYVSNANDCDDLSNAIYPGATEDCDGVDNNCDGAIDENIGDVYYLDGDGDGYGTEESATLLCQLSDGYSIDTGDCEDNNNTVFPGASEICDDLDNNCDGQIDEGVGNPFYLDYDEDGFGNPEQESISCRLPEGYVENDWDCNDIDSLVYPGAIEFCDNTDNNCDGQIDESGAQGESNWYLDNDGDGFGDPNDTQQACQQPSSYVDNPDDCDDGDISITNIVTWYLDYDSDGYGDDAYPIQICQQPTGYVANNSDCDDLDSQRTPNLSWYLDLDGDGYGANVQVIQCTQPMGYVMNDLDCNDTEVLAYTGAIEVCDYVDNNCDGQIDEQVIESWYLDYDSDGYGDDTTFSEACEAPTPYYVNIGGDCDDEDAAFSPGVAQGCDQRDLNCDGDIDNDADEDGYSDAVCGGSDCDDSDPMVIPEQSGGCAVGESCLDILTQGKSVGSGLYDIDPDGFGAGMNPFEVYCDMTSDGGGWTQIEYILVNDGEGYNQDYASVFSSIERGTLGAGSYKVMGALLLDSASSFRYSEPNSLLGDSFSDSWNWDFSCLITPDVLSNIQNPGYQNQGPADVVCTDINSGSVSSNAVYMNYQQWGGCWTGPRLWVGSTYSAPQYHGDYCLDCISTWKCSNTTNGVYSGPSMNYQTSTAFWLR